MIWKRLNDTAPDYVPQEHEHFISVVADGCNLYYIKENPADIKVYHYKDTLIFLDEHWDYLRIYKKVVVKHIEYKSPLRQRVLKQITIEQ